MKNQNTRRAIKVKQFRYNSAQKKSRANPSKVQNIPIRTIVQKISSVPQLTMDIQKESKSQLFQLSKTNVDMSFKKFITPRDTQYKAKPFMFDRFKYENYENYEYKNPFKPAKLGQQDRVMRPGHKNIKKGTDKNLQIIFCEQKLQNFVKKTNDEIKDLYELKKRQSFSNINLHQRNTPITRSKSLSSTQRNTMRQNIIQKRSKRSTLSNYLQQFNTLEKLSVYMEREHKLNEKFLFSSFSDNSRTVLVDIVVHRFEFLKKLKKKIKDLVFKVILNLEELPTFYKINIHQYLKFTQLFVSRDADTEIITMFILSFLFKEARQINFDVAKAVLDQIGGSASKHAFVEEKLDHILSGHESEGQKLFYSIKQDLLLQTYFLDLIIGKQ